MAHDKARDDVAGLDLRWIGAGVNGRVQPAA